MPPRVRYVGQRVEGDQVVNDYEDETGSRYSVPNEYTLSKVGATPAYDHGPEFMERFRLAQEAEDNAGHDVTQLLYRKHAAQTRKDHPPYSFSGGPGPHFTRLDGHNDLGLTRAAFEDGPDWQELSDKPNPVFKVGPIGPLNITGTPSPAPRTVITQRPGTLSDVTDHERLHVAAVQPGEPLGSKYHGLYAGLSDRDKLLWDREKQMHHDRDSHVGHDSATSEQYTTLPDGTAEHRMSAAVNELRRKLGL